MVTDAFLDGHADLLEPLHQALSRAVDDAIADPAAAAANAADALNMPSDVVAASIPHSNLVAVRATESRSAIEAMLTVLAEADPAVIGGHVPDADFYL